MVVTVAVKLEAVLALTCSVAGTLQTAPLGAPVQVSEAVPLIPPPPIDSEYVAFEPAVNLAELEPPEAMPSASEGFPPVPESATACGLSGASSVIVRVPVRLPLAVGVKVTLTVQLALGPSDAPQLLLSEKSPLA